ncbi:hypothetical protein HK405_014237 [Cladochytrium tenue]|nr:hypothetical protein HK405_014237 [Cladochytrium tenue]
MIPIPQYPLYTAAVANYNGKVVPYYLDEESGWSLSTDELERAYKEAADAGIDVRALVVINPGNPTSQCLSEDNVHEILAFAQRKHLAVLADEVYQANIYAPQHAPFHSFKKVLRRGGDELANVELFSFHTISKGMIGECGRRGIDPGVMAQLYKMASISLCPPVQGQIMVGLMVNPPREGDESYEQFVKEETEIFESLRRRAVMLHKAFNELEGVTCNYAQGAMYLFPKLTFSEKAIAVAEAIGKQPDEMYCMQLLEATGVCVVPGTGFLQRPGTWHFRSTFLPPEDEMGEFAAGIAAFHAAFMDKHR